MFRRNNTGSPRPGSPRTGSPNPESSSARNNRRRSQSPTSDILRRDKGKGRDASPSAPIPKNVNLFPTDSSHSANASRRNSNASSHHHAITPNDPSRPDSNNDLSRLDSNNDLSRLDSNNDLSRPDSNNDLSRPDSNNDPSRPDSNNDPSRLDYNSDYYPTQANFNGLNNDGLGIQNNGFGFGNDSYAYGGVAPSNAFSPFNTGLRMGIVPGGLGQKMGNDASGLGIMQKVHELKSNTGKLRRVDSSAIDMRKIEKNIKENNLPESRGFLTLMVKGYVNGTTNDLSNELRDQIVKVHDNLAQKKRDGGLLKEQIDELKKIADEQVKVAKEKYEQGLKDLNQRVEAISQRNATEAQPWIINLEAWNETGKEVGVTVKAQEELLKTLAPSLANAHAEYFQTKDTLSKEVTSMREVLKKVSDAHAGGTSYDEITFKQYDKALSQAQSNKTTLEAANKAANEAFEANKAQNISYPTHEINNAYTSIAEHTSGNFEDHVVNTVKELLKDTVVKDNTDFRLTKSDNNKTYLNVNEYNEKRLKEILALPEVKQAIGRIRTEESESSNQKELIRGELKKAMKAASDYSAGRNAYEERIHAKAAKSFIDQVTAGAQTRQNFVTMLTEEKEISRFKDADVKMHEALDLIQHFSPEAKAARETFLRSHADTRDTNTPSEISLTNRDSAIVKIKNLKDARTKLPEEIQARIDADTNTNMNELTKLAKDSIDKFRTMWEKGDQDNDVVDQNAVHHYEQMKKQINDHYNPKIEKAQNTYTQEQGKPDKSEIISKAAWKDFNNLVAQRQAALGEAHRLYAKESLPEQMNEVKAQARNLQERLDTRDKKLQAAYKVVRAIERANATIKVYTDRQFGEGARLDIEIKEFREAMAKPALDFKTAEDEESAAGEKLRRAETAFKEARQTYELRDRNSREAAKVRDDGPDTTRNEEIKSHKAMLHDHAEAAKVEYLKREEDVRVASQEHEAAVQNRIQKKTTLNDAEGDLHNLEYAREIARKRDDAIDAKQAIYRTDMTAAMKAAEAFYKQKQLMKEYQKTLMRAAMISSLSQAYMDVLSRVYHTTYMSIMNRLMQG